MKKVKLLCLLLLLFMSIPILSACSKSSSKPSNTLTQDSVYNYLQTQGYTGISKLSETQASSYGLTDAVQSQSMNYVIIGKVKDIDTLKKAFPSIEATQLSVQEGQWFYSTNVKIGTLSTTDSLKDIQ